MWCPLKTAFRFSYLKIELDRLSRNFRTVIRCSRPKYPLVLRLFPVVSNDYFSPTISANVLLISGMVGEEFNTLNDFKH